jgi:RHS repeat-associated protein
LSSSTQKLNLGLYYNNVPSGLSANAQFNGNIAGLVWNTPEQSGALSPNVKQGYGFTYDGLNRMRTSTYGEGATFTTNVNANNENVDYDQNGNIKTLTRFKKGIGPIDNLTYTYKNNGASNMLDRVDDAFTGAEGFSENNIKHANEYVYDGNGNLISDDNKGFDEISYNYLNLPRQVGTTGQYISYVYDAVGTKLAKINTGGAYTYYAGSFVYSGSSLNYIINREGMYLPGGNYQYYLKDHLGNTRLVVNTSGVGGTVVQQTDYYPFGMDIATYNGGLDNKYRYNGKEFQEDVINGKRLDWYDYGARFYDPVILRWNSVDPLAEKYFDWSPYNYVANNPIRFIDPEGLDIWISYGEGQRVRYENGKLYNEDGKIYKGKDDFVSTVFSTLKTIGSSEIGSNVLGELSTSKNDFNFVNKTPTSSGENDMRFKFERGENGGGQILAGNLMNSKVTEAAAVEATSHELFHGYQYEKGELGKMGNSPNNEVGAYLFGKAIALNTLGTTPFNGNNTAAGKLYGNAMNNLFSSDNFSYNLYKKAVNNFVGGSSSNSNGAYKNLKAKPNDINPLIKKFFPLRFR